MDAGHPRLAGDPFGAGRHTQQRVHLRRPVGLAARDVPVPDADAAAFGGEHHPLVRPLEGVPLRRAPGDVLEGPEHADRFPVLELGTSECTHPAFLAALANEGQLEIPVPPVDDAAPKRVANRLAGLGGVVVDRLVQAGAVARLDAVDAAGPVRPRQDALPQVELPAADVGQRAGRLEHHLAAAQRELLRLALGDVLHRADLGDDDTVVEDRPRQHAHVAHDPVLAVHAELPVEVERELDRALPVAGDADALVRMHRLAPAPTLPARLSAGTEDRAPAGVRAGADARPVGLEDAERRRLAQDAEPGLARLERGGHAARLECVGERGGQAPEGRALDGGELASDAIDDAERARAGAVGGAHRHAGAETDGRFAGDHRVVDEAFVERRVRNLEQLAVAGLDRAEGVLAQRLGNGPEPDADLRSPAFVVDEEESRRRRAAGQRGGLDQCAEDGFGRVVERLGVPPRGQSFGLDPC